jgi:glycosyl hydrolase family 115 (putative glucuronidase)/glycosyl hydrolase family 115
MTRWISLLAFLAAALSPAAHALGEKPWVAYEDSPGAVRIANGEELAHILVDSGEHEAVRRAAAGLQADVERVTGRRPGYTSGAKAISPHTIVIGTLGASGFIDSLAATGAIDVSSIRGQWEGFVIQVVDDPTGRGGGPLLVIAGSDRRGTIFGIYTLSEQIGVSPWYWWADVPAQKRERLYVPAGTKVADQPVVKYRGIFLNDEEPALGNWGREKFGGLNHKMYERVFELILRLRGNYLWPAMWRTGFFDDDPLNGKLADEYGIVMGTSHHEPLMRAQVEWRRHGGGGPWDYEKNAERLREFWSGGLANTRGYEKIITLGMRGDGDMPMTPDANVRLLERIVADQRAIIAKEIAPDVTRVPQAWMLYKEVQEYYEKGMRVPDDVTLLWCDDNFANIRRLPTPEERKRAGGAGIYYHFDYYGGPRSYKWINVTPLPKVWEQMHLAWRHEATRMWIVNVGDLKPMEVPIEFFLSYAWNPARWPADRVDRFLELWAAREFGPEHAADIAGIVAKYAKYNGRRKPESLDSSTYSLVNYREAETVVADFNAIAARAEKISAALPAAKRDAFYELVLYPAKAAAVVSEIHVMSGLNRIYAAQGRAETNDLAARVRRLFAEDAELTRRFHEDIAGGKWNHMMSQTHLGYITWSDPPRNVMPPVTEIQVPKAAEMGVAVEGNESAWRTPLALPEMSVFERRSRYIEIFNRGEEPFRYTIAASAPWIALSRTEGSVAKSERIEVSARWDEVPPDAEAATLTISGPGERKPTVRVSVRNPSRGRPGGAGFVEAQGVVSIEAEHFAHAAAPTAREWLRIPDHGRTLSGMTTLPVDASPEGMRLEYAMHLFDAGKVTVHATLAPTQKIQPGPGLRFAIAFDDEKPQVVNLHADESRAYWSRSVLDGAVTFTTDHVLARPGAHTLKYWPLDSGIVLQKLVVDAGGLKPSYLGPPESPLIRP